VAPRRKLATWIAAGGAILLIVTVAAWFAARRIAAGLEPALRDQAVRYLGERFHSDVELAALHLRMPKLSTLNVLWKHGRGARVRVEGEGLSMLWKGARERPRFFRARRFWFDVDLGILLDDRKTVEQVVIEGLELQVPPKGNGSGSSSSMSMNVLLNRINITDGTLSILPKDPTKTPLRFTLHHVNLVNAGAHAAMNYDALLTIPKPAGEVHSRGTFGPWNADEPGDSPLTGRYTLENADLGVFDGIAGLLQSTGAFNGTLDEVHARGEARVPDFRLTLAGNPVALSTQFEVLVDGTNGNTTLQPVKATLGSTRFTTTGAVVKHEEKRARLIDLTASMPDGSLRDVLRLAMKGPPFMEGRITLRTQIGIPALSGPVRDKLRLDGTFALREAHFLRSTIQDQIDQLSRRGQGQPENREIDEVVSHMNGAFRLENRILTFRKLSFGVPGADVDVSGNYDMVRDTVDFHGTLKLVARVSNTMTGWKRWALKPVDPFFAKNGAGTFLRIQITGPASHPEFKRDTR
jgi:hypothetical protein